MSLIKKNLETFNARATNKQAKASLVSDYDPKGSARDRLMFLTREFETAESVRDRGYEEFNNKTLMNIADRDRKAFNNFIEPASNDPAEKWRANTIRPITRNKVISIAAHITASLLFPNILAQNDADEEDKAAAIIMRDLINWSLDQGDYSHTFVKAVVRALTDPAVIVYEGYSEIYRRIKDVMADGTWKEKWVQDEIYSGFQNLLVPVEELFIGNIYESNIQKQPFLIWRRVITYDAARIKYGDNKNFQKYVEPGVKHLYVDTDKGFYKMADSSLEQHNVEEIIYYNRSEDLELRVVNGVLLDDPERPIQRKDKLYPFAKTGYEFFGGTDFFYYKSLVDKMSSDQEVIDTLYNMVIDGTYLSIMRPAVVIGDEEIDSAVIGPGVVTTLESESEFKTIDTNADLNAGMNMLAKVESSASESSTDPRMSGVGSSTTPPTAFDVQRQESNARTVLGLFGKMITKFVEDFGKLRIDSILQHMTVAEGVDIVGDATRLKYRSFLVEPSEDGKKMKKINFSNETPADKEGQRKRSYELYDEEENKGMTICDVNPMLFRRNKYMIKVNADFMPSQSDAVKKALNLELYDRAIQNPFSDHSAVTADFLYETYKPGESDKYMAKKKGLLEQAGLQGKPGNSNMTSQILNKAEGGKAPA